MYDAVCQDCANEGLGLSVIVGSEVTPSLAGSQADSVLPRTFDPETMTEWGSRIVLRTDTMSSWGKDRRGK